MRRKVRRRSLRASFSDRIKELSTGRRPARLFIWGVVGAGVVLLLYLLILSLGLPSLEQLEEYNPELTTKIYSANGEVIKEFAIKKRVFVSLDAMPDHVWQSVIASEDHRFFHHWGIVPIRWFKAAWVGLLHFQTPRGVSTISQQLARDLYLTQEKTISRKIREIMTAIQIERTYTKREILEMYLNNSYMGPGGIYGMQAAARYYFDKDVQDVTLPEAAVLTQLLPNAGYYSPYAHPERALGRRNVVLGRMKIVGYITEEEYKEATKTPLGVVPRKESEGKELAPYFTEYIRRRLWGVYGNDVYEGGLNVYTTLDTRVQAAADVAIRAHIPKVEERQRSWLLSKARSEFSRLVDPKTLRDVGLNKLLTDKAFIDSVLAAKAKVQVALVTIDPTNGHILAMVGGRDFEESEWNRATQAKRQPGSVFKPFVYLAAIDNGYLPTHELLNQPVVVDMPDGSRWTPPNYDGSIGGKTTLREGLAMSRNLVTARLVLEEVPPPVVVEYAKRFGLTTELVPVAAISLGASDVIPLEITSAFGALGNKGVLVEPVAILRVEDKYGNILEEHEPTRREVIGEESAYILTDMMKSVLNNGTGITARTVYGFYRPAAGKTGTTNDFADAWFIGFTPQIVAGVWVGTDDPSVGLGEGQSGAVAALPIWAPFMKAIHDSLHLPVKDFVQPDGVVRLEICNDTKMLATESCPDIVEEVFNRRHQPTEYCTKHTGFEQRDRRHLLGKRKNRF